MMTNPFVPAPERMPLGELLLKEGALDRTQLNAALEEQKAWGGRLGRTLIELGLVDERRVASALARQLGIEEAELDAARPEPRALRTLTVEVCRLFCVLPLEIDERHDMLRLATFDPDEDTFAELQRVTGLKIEPVIAPAADIERAIQRHYFGGEAPRPLNDRPFEPGPAAAPPPREPELAERVEKLERLVAAQSRAIRELVELLAKKGAIVRADLKA
jgi:type IV pilus assembly protein PilB